ncbi:MAG: hypothetical protein Q7R95_11520 [bacterium]|nr:hypothetical protein [bacterium]
MIIIDRDEQCYWDTAGYKYTKINWNDSDKKYYAGIDILNKKVAIIEEPFLQKRTSYMHELTSFLDDNLEALDFTKEDLLELHRSLWYSIQPDILDEIQKERNKHNIDTWQYYKQLSILMAEHCGSNPGVLEKKIK